MTNRYPSTRKQTDPLVRFKSHVIVHTTEDGCDLWTGYLLKGHGRFYNGEGKQEYAHRWWWKKNNGPIPPGYVVDHTCHDPRVCDGGPTCPHRRCVRLSHMVVVPRGRNTSGDRTSRGRQQRNTADAREVCRYGHPLSEQRVPGRGSERKCPTCLRDATRRYRASKRLLTAQC